MDAFRSIIKLAKVERRVGAVANLLEQIVEYNIAHPKIIEIIEHQIIFGSIIKNMSDIIRFVSAGQKCDFFSDRFYDTLFYYSLKILPSTHSSEAVKLVKLFDAKRSPICFDANTTKRAYLEEFTEKSSQLKVNIAQDMDKTAMDDLCYLI